MKITSSIEMHRINVRNASFIFVLRVFLMSLSEDILQLGDFAGVAFDNMIQQAKDTQENFISNNHRI